MIGGSSGLMGATGGLGDDLGDLLHVAADFGGRRCLFFGCSGDLVNLRIDIVDLLENLLERPAGVCRLLAPLGDFTDTLFHGDYRALRFLLDGLDHLTDFPGRSRGALGQSPHLIGNNGETSPLLSRPGRLDCCIQGQQVGLVSDILDGADDFSNLV